jgi:hypothetical protein
MERLICMRIITHIEANCILAQEQYGFRTQPSTENAAFSLINSILTVMKNKQMVDGIFYDLQKAFDHVNHKILDKLDFYGIEGTFKTLIISYLIGRHQRVVLIR